MNALSVSVAMTTFNGGAYVEEQLLSILRQSRPPDEVVVADDGSVDGTVEIVERVAAAGAPVRVLRAERRLGVVANVERSLGHCNGDVIFLADQDDVWVPDKIVVILRALDASVGACFSDADLLVGDELRGTLWGAVGFDARLRDRWERDPMSVLVKRNVVTGATLAFERRLLDGLLPLPPSGWHDLSLAVLLAARTTVAALPDRLVHYRRHEAQATGVDTRRLIARRRTDNAWSANLEAQHEHWLHLTQRLCDIDAPAAAIALAEQKASFVRSRLGTRRRAVGRLVALAQLARGRYHRFGSGFATAFRDLTASS